LLTYLWKFVITKHIHTHTHTHTHTPSNLTSWSLCCLNALNRYYILRFCAIECIITFSFWRKHSVDLLSSFISLISKIYIINLCLYYRYIQLWLVRNKWLARLKKREVCDAAGQFLDSIYYQEIGKREEREIVNIHIWCTFVHDVWIHFGCISSYVCICIFYKNSYSQQRRRNLKKSFI